MPTGHVSLMPALRRAVFAGAADRTDGQLLGAFVTATGGGSGGTRGGFPQSQEAADAFGLLVRRHGPMVLGVCRRVIGDHATAEDAFQAVFLVLARRAAAVEPREQVGSWLYGVAYRTALKARAVLARRRSREKQVDVMPEPPVRNPGGFASPGSPDEWADLQPVIDEELARLPEKLRAPVVLCDLEGRSQREVAKHLGVPPATLATRLASARRTLAQRLTRRGVTLSGGAVAALLTAHGAAAAVPPALAHGLVRAAEALAAGTACSGLVSASAVQLSEGVMRMMLLTKLKAVVVVALTAAAVTGGLGLGLIPARAAGGPGDDPAPARVAKADPPAIPPADPLDPAPATGKVEKVIELALAADPKVADAEFLRRLSLDLRGVPPTEIETLFFVADEDENKRDKLVAWLIDDEDARAFAAEKLGVPAGRVVLVRKADDAGDEPRVVVVARVAPAPQDRAPAVARVLRRVEVGADEDPKNSKLLVWDAADGKKWAVTGDGKVQVWDAAGKANGVWVDGPAGWVDADGRRLLAAPLVRDLDVDVTVVGGESDLEFLKRVTTAARGTPPTALEERYFTEDKDPKKREKLIDSLLKEPAVAKKLGDDFKKRMMAGAGKAKEDVFRYFVFPEGGKDGQKFEFKFPEGFPFDPKGGQKFEFKFDPKGMPFVPKDGKFEFKIDPKVAPFLPKDLPFKFEIELGPDGKPMPPVPPKPPAPPKPPQPGAKAPQPPVPPVPPQPPQPRAEKLGKLVDELLAAKKSDAEMLEALTLATAGRLPTDVEKRLTLGLVAKTADRKAAWLEVAKAMAGGGGEAKRVEVELVIPKRP